MVPHDRPHRDNTECTPSGPMKTARQGKIEQECARNSMDRRRRQTDNSRDADQPQGLPSEVFRWVRVLFWCNLIAVPASALLHGEHFDVATHPLSWLGNPSTVNGLPNQHGMLIFNANLLLSSFVCFRLSRLSWRSGRRPLFRLTGALFLVAAMGLVLTIVPCATHDPIHRLGAGLMTTALWLLSFALLAETRRFAHTLWFYGAVIANHLFLYVYAFLFFSNRPGQVLLQKVAFFGLLCNLYLPARKALAPVAEEAEEPEPGPQVNDC